MTKPKTVSVDELKEILEKFHNKDCWQQTQTWFSSFEKDFVKRSQFLSEIMYSAEPLTPDSIKPAIGNFNVLQGDIIKTKSAITNDPVFIHDIAEYAYYVIIPSSCSIQPSKYEWVLLARLWPIENLDDKVTQSAYTTALRFQNTKLFYFPPIDSVGVGSLGFLGVFEEISYMKNSLLQSVTRVASLTEIGWHLLNAFIVNHFTRPSGDDAKIRKTESPSNWSLE